MLDAPLIASKNGIEYNEKYYKWNEHEVLDYYVGCRYLHGVE